jgi:asparagine synthase (glutamine-hydrolysing)
LFSGRIFNAAELAGELGVERAPEPLLLLHAHARWGEEFVQHLDGEYSFVLWDGDAQRLLLGRDPSGFWPMFYLRRGEEFFFSNEVRRLMAWQPALPDENHIAHWLAAIPTGTDSTFFRNILCLPPGHMLRFENGRATLNAWWQPEKLPLLVVRDSREYAEGLLDVLRAAIKARLQPEAVVGSHMSGGLDSTSVTALAAGLLQPENRRLFAFTAVPKYPAGDASHLCDEGPNAASVAALYPNMDHVLVRHGSHSTLALMDRYSSAEQQPIASPASYDWLHEIALQARQRGIETLITGGRGNVTISHAGDLALPGLARQRRFLTGARLARDLRRNGNTRWLSAVYQMLRPWMPAWSLRSIEHIRGRGTNFYEKLLIRREFARAHGLDAAARDVYFGSSDGRTHRLRSLRQVEPGPMLEAFRQISGISMTDPTMDRRVFEYCFSVPEEYYCEKGVRRSLIRSAMAGLLPDQVRTERRIGVQAADFGRHFEKDRKEYLDELARMKKVDLAARALDLPRIEEMMRWSEARIVEYSEPHYWGHLMCAFSLGRFLRRLEDGTLLSLQEPSPERNDADIVPVASK